MYYSKIRVVLDTCLCPKRQERIIMKVSFFISFPNLFLNILVIWFRITEEKHIEFPQYTWSSPKVDVCMSTHVNMCSCGVSVHSWVGSLCIHVCVYWPLFQEGVLIIPRTKQ